MDGQYKYDDLPYYDKAGNEFIVEAIPLLKMG